jgi:AraC-like DNA-binding protein
MRWVALGCELLNLADVCKVRSATLATRCKCGTAPSGYLDRVHLDLARAGIDRDDHVAQ